MVSKLSPKSWDSSPKKKALSEVCIAGSARTYLDRLPKSLSPGTRERPWVSAWVGQADGNYRGWER